MAGGVLGLKNMNLFRSDVGILSLSIEGSSDSWVVISTVRGVSVSFGNKIMHLLWLDVGIELVFLLILRFLLLQECVLFLGVESGLALSDNWLENADTLRRKLAVLFGPLNTFVTSLREEGSSGVRVVQVVLLWALVGEHSV